jgi:hypothetical protein
VEALGGGRPVAQRGERPGARLLVLAGVVALLRQRCDLRGESKNKIV